MPILLDPLYDYQVKGSKKIFKGKDLLPTVKKGKVSSCYFLVSGSRDYEGHSLGTSVLLRSPINILGDLSEQQIDEFLESFILTVVEDCTDPEELHPDDLVKGMRNTYYNEDKEPIGVTVDYEYRGDSAQLFIKLIDNLREAYEFKSSSSTLIVNFSYAIGFSSTD